MIWLLLVVYQLKHFLADYPLQGKYMLGKFQPYPKFILPLLAHAGVHAAFTFLIAVCFKPVGVALGLGLLDATIHFVVDRIKASPDLLGRFKPLTKETYIAAAQANDQAAIRGNTFFWWALGWDQAMHHLTHYFLIWMIL